MGIKWSKQEVKDTWHLVIDSRYDALSSCDMEVVNPNPVPSDLVLATQDMFMNAPEHCCEVVWHASQQSQSDLLVNHSSKDFTVRMGFDIGFKPNVVQAGTPGRELYVKLWHAGGKVSSQESKFQYAAMSLKITACAYSPASTAAASQAPPVFSGLQSSNDWKAIKLVANDRQRMVVDDGVIADDTARKYTLYSAQTELTAAAKPKGTIKVEGKQAVQEASQKAGATVPIVLLEHTDDHFYMPKATSCTVLLQQNIRNALLCGRKDRLGYIGGFLGPDEDKTTGPVIFRGWTGTASTVPIFLQVLVEFKWAKSAKLKKGETSIGEYIVDALKGEQLTGLQGVVQYKMQQKV